MDEKKNSILNAFELCHIYALCLAPVGIRFWKTNMI